MYYVLFHWSKGKLERDFQGFRSEDEMVDFICEKRKEIELYRIIEPAREYRFGLVVSEEFIISTMDEEEREIIHQNKAALEKADKAIAAAEELEGKKKDWTLCSKCGVNKVAPWNKKGICSPCQKPKGTRKYTRRKL